MSSPNQQPIAPNNNEIISNEPVAKHRLSEEEEVLNPASLAFFSWVSPMLARGWKKFQAGELLEDADLMRLPRDESASNSYSVFNALYKDWKADVQEKMKLAGEAAAIADPNKNREPAGSSDVQEDEDPEIATQKRIAAAILAAESELHNPMKILGLMVRASRRDVLLGCFFRLFQDGSSIASPFVLRALIKWLAEYAVFGSEGGITKWEGFVYGIVLAILSFLMWVFTNLSLFYTNKAFSRMRAAFAMAVYEKTLKLDRSQLANVGRIQQMHSSDTYKFVDMSLFINTIWAAPLVIIGALIALYFFVGWAGLLSLATLILISPSQGVIMKGMMMVRIATAGIADERIQAVNEFCQGIRIIKFMGWEPSTIKNILAIRTKEVARFSESNFYRSSLLTVMFSTSLLISLVVFAVAYAIGHPVSLENVFPAIAMINVLRQPLTQLPIGIARIVDCNVGLKRICEYLCLEEKKTYIKPFATAEEESVNAAVLENVTAIYEVGGDTDPMKKKEVAGRGGAGGRGGRGGRGGDRGGRGGSGAPSPASPKADGSPASPADGPVAPVERVFRPFMGPISVALPRKKLTIVIGPTGSGKSTLLDMVIGEALVD
ncbi:ABC transporter, putative, partial [Bodo saltans]